jgi:sterol desaturase/sphingolipid hydroxylase (fatty acid hydroxylase superfamily)
MTRHSEVLTRQVPGWLSGTLIFGALAAIVWFENRRPLRQPTQSKSRRDLRNVAVAMMSAAAIRLTEKPVASALTGLVHRKNWGVVKWMRLPAWLEVAAAAVLLDYTLYIWHVLTHKVDFLWRFHEVHHADLDLDATTALRFHFVEMVLSVPWRAAQILVIGASPLSLSVWQTATLVEIMFHHSNVELPLELERWLSRLIVTPRMHGIHHSIVREETDSNWSTILSFPDYLHRTLRLNVPQRAITIGVPAYRDPEELELGEILVMPFGHRRETWRLQGRGEKPERGPRPGAPALLLG